MKTLITILLFMFTFTGLAATYFVDPDSKAETPAGTESDPFNKWAQIEKSFANNNTYFFKRGTVLNNMNFGTLKALSQVSFGAYGTGNLPILNATSTGTSVKALDFGGQLNNVLIKDLEITSTSGSVVCLINIARSSTNVSLINLVLHNAGWGIRARALNSAAPNDVITDLSIINCRIYDCNDDGIYLYKVIGVNVINTTIFNVNRNWGEGVDQTQAAGDCIQAILCARQNYSGGIYSRSKLGDPVGILSGPRSGNKFCLIISSHYPVENNYLTIQGVVFVSPKTTSQGGAAIYIGNGLNGEIYFYFNHVIGDKTTGVTGLTGLWYQASSGVLASSGNKYSYCSRGISHLNTAINKLYISDDWFYKCGTPAYPATSQKPVRGVTVTKY